jgi:hypothetical protein
LQQQVNEHITAQSSVVLNIVNISDFNGWPRGIVFHVVQTLMGRRNELMAKYNNESHFYEKEAARPPSSTGGTGDINIYGTLNGAAQTGNNATATVRVDMTGIDRLLQAITDLQTAIGSAQGLTKEERAQGTQQATDVITEVKAPSPNWKRVLWLLKGLGMTAETVTVLHSVWMRVHDAAVAMGLNLLLP